MKFYLDTADVDEIREAASWGVLDGVTTNPSLVAKTGREYRDVLTEILEIVDGPISAEVIAVDYEGIVKEGRELAAIHPNIVVKVPLIVEGIKATRTLAGEGVRVNNTLCFSPSQALLSAKAGAAYVSPFVGRLDDISHDGMELVEQIIQIYANYGFDTEVIVASVRHPQHLVQAALMGADIATLPFKIFQQAIKHPLTDIGLAKFLADYEKVSKR
ncbi:MAG TPA: fructose-6-phosphate aldolase [Bacteroidetes bacterium]|nr:fructose-6-phosphate aldolase [Bacteroidota bacterium]